MARGSILALSSRDSGADAVREGETMGNEDEEDEGETVRDRTEWKVEDDLAAAARDLEKKSEVGELGEDGRRESCKAVDIGVW